VGRNGRIVIVGVLFAVAVGLVVFTVMAFLRSSPATVDFATGHQSGQPVDMTLQTVGALGYGPHLTWVSYLTKDPEGQWVHTTLWDLPANTQINVTIEEFDTGSPLRNQQVGMVTGTIGDDMTVNGKTTNLINSNDPNGNGVAHTFSIPTLGINVPLYGVNGSASSFCGVAAPCPLSAEHNIVKFSFMTPGPGQYPWQCFVPCGAGYLYGNGGPMQTVGYMDGFLKVVA
jgi:hypothetical protein